MSKLNSEIEYPISPNVLIDYIKTTSVYPVYMGIDFISFSTEPFWGGRELPPHVEVYYNSVLDRSEVRDILLRLNLRIDDFETHLTGNL